MINLYVCKSLTPVNSGDSGIVENSCVYNPHLGAGLHDQPERGVVHVGAVGQVQVLQGNMFFYSDTRDKQTATKKYEGVPFTWIAK